MKTGFRGTFVFSWTQVELEGSAQANPQTIRVGMPWRWTGEAVRVDGPAGILPLGEPLDLGDLRKHVSRSAQPTSDPAFSVLDDLDDGQFDEGFTVTDGRQVWALTLIRGARPQSWLCVCVDDLPPCGRDLWVVSVSLPTTATSNAEKVAQSQSGGGVICFTPGTMIQTEQGPQRIEEIREGTKVQTKDNGCQEVLWTGSRQITGARLKVMPELCPVRLRAGSLDNGVPDAGLLVSPDHRVMIKGARAQALFNTNEILVRAGDLVNDTSIHVERGLRGVTYIHMLLHQHEIVFANGVQSESFHPASAALDHLADDARARMFATLPGLEADPTLYGAYARRALTSSEAAILRYDGALA